MQKPKIYGLALAVLALPLTSWAQGVHLNEVVADNGSIIADEFDEFEDYIELYNDGAILMDLSGYGLSDDVLEPFKWTLPAEALVPASGHLLVWADGDTAQGALHAPFSVNADGEAIFLHDGTGAFVDSLSFDDLPTNVAWGRRTDGSATVGYSAPTPEAANPDNAPAIIREVTAGPAAPTAGQAFDVALQVDEDDGDPLSVELIYNTGGGDVTVSLVQEDSLWVGSIPALDEDTEVHYYLTAVDDQDAGTRKPASAPISTYHYEVFVGISPITVNEFMADNLSTIADGEGAFEDWIELVNLSNVEVDAGGLFLSDDPENPDQWKIPNGTTIPARGYLLIWADNDSGDPGLHTNFKLSKGGEFLGLYSSTPTGNVPLDTLSFGAQITDVSFARSADGLGEFASDLSPTPESYNGGTGLYVVATPNTSPVVVPPGQGQFGYHAAIFNRGAFSRSTKGWTVAVLDGNATDALLGPAPLTIAGRDYFSIGLAQPVPPNAPSGPASYELRVGTYPSIIEASDAFDVLRQ